MPSQSWTRSDESDSEEVRARTAEWSIHRGMLGEIAMHLQALAAGALLRIFEGVGAERDSP